MSISLALIPAALVVRAAMGKENFENWVKSSELRMSTNFKSKKELVTTLKKAGYDAKNFGNVIKTHIDGRWNFIYWERVNGRWTAVLSKYDSKERIATFINNLEKIAGRKIICDSINESHQLSTKIEEETFLTNFVDTQLLLKTLKDYGINDIEVLNGNIQCNVENCALTFYKEEDMNYRVRIKGGYSLKHAYNHLNIMDEEYKKNIQAYTYEKVVEKLSKTNMYIENEEVMNDNSIVLTINIGG